MALFKKQKQVPMRRRADYREQSVSNSPSANPFRRGRTLTGSTSLSSAAETKAQLKSPRAQVHELAGKRRHLGGLLLLVLLASAVLYSLISQFTASAAVRATDGISLAEPTVYEKAIQQYLVEHPAERLRFLLNIPALQNFLQTQTPEVAKVRLEGSAGFGVSAFQLTMRQPIAGWSMKADHQQFVDATGAAFEKNYFDTPQVKINDQTGIPLEAGRAVTSNRFLGFVGLAVGLADSYGYQVQEVILPRDTTREIELRLKNVSYPIKLSVDRPAGEQVEDAARAVKWLHDRGKQPKYVDVRVSGKAFYKE